MKEFQLIDDVMPDVPPADPARTMGIRARLMDRAPRRRPPTWSRVTLAAAAVTLVLVGGFVVVPRLGGSEVDTAATSNVPAVLAAAADRLAAQPPGTGAWWRREMRQVWRTGTKAQPAFIVEQRGGGEVLWVNRDGERRAERKPVTAEPFTPADKRAWKAAGSPLICASKSGCTIGRVFFVPLDTEKLEPVAELPTDAEALKAELLKQYPEDNLGGQDSRLWAAGRWLLLDAPSTPGTRAAVYRMLAGLPHVKVADGVKDDKGRAGVALLLGDPLQQQIIIDRDSGDLLAVQSQLLRPDGKQGLFAGDKPFESLLVERLGWTDEQPTARAERQPGSR